MKTIERLLQATKKLKEHLDRGIQEDRDEYIQAISNLLDEREACIKRLPQTYSEEEKQIGRQIVALNRHIDLKLNEQLLFFKNEIEQFQKNKRRQKQYANPYTHLSADGMYFDKRK